MVVATSTLLAISTGVSASSQLSSGMQAKQQGKDNQRIYEAQAKFAEAKSGLEKFRAIQEFGVKERQASAQIAASGGSLSGTALHNLNKLYTNAELDINLIEQQGRLESGGLRTQGTAAKQRGDAAMSQAIIGAAGSLIQGGSKINQAGGF